MLRGLECPPLGIAVVHPVDLIDQVINVIANIDTLILNKVTLSEFRLGIILSLLLVLLFLLLLWLSLLPPAIALLRIFYFRIIVGLCLVLLVGTESLGVDCICQIVELILGDFIVGLCLGQLLPIRALLLLFL